MKKSALQSREDMIIYPLFGALAQLVAHNTGSVGVRSSNLLCSTSKGPSNRMVLLLVEVREPRSLPILPGSGGGKALSTASGGNIDRAFLARNKRAPQCGVAPIEGAEQEFDDCQWRKYRRRLSQPKGSDLHSMESRPLRLRNRSSMTSGGGNCISRFPMRNRGSLIVDGNHG